MQVVKNSQGYTMIFTIVLVVLFSILGMSLLAITSNGTSKNESRQGNAQAIDLAEKGITFISEQITYELEQKKETIDKITNLSLKKDAITSTLNEIIAKYSCSNTTMHAKSTSGTGQFEACINNISLGSSEASRVVTFKSTGTSIHKEKASTLIATSEIGFSNIPEALNYAVSTNEDGNLYLFGGVEILGNVKVANTLYTYNRAFWSSTSNPRWEDSMKPFIKSTNGITAPIIFTQNFKMLNNNNVAPSNLFTKSPNVSATNISSSNIDSALHVSESEPKPIITSEMPANVKIEVGNIVTSIGGKVGQRISGVLIKQYNSPTFNGANGQQGAINSHSTSDQEATYIPGNMRIGRYSANGNYSNDITQYREFNLNGNYYVNGDLIISGAKLKGNAVIYVKGNVDIEFSTINAGEDAKSNTIFIFAEKPIEIHNISVNSSPAYENGNIKSNFMGSYINGFFYTNSNLLMYGVGSNTKITGGVSAKHTIFTALRGHGVDELHKNASPPVESTCAGVACSCERNAENSDDRGTSGLNQFEMVNKNTLRATIQNKSRPFNMTSSTFNTRKNILLNLLDTPYGALSRPLTQADIGKSLYLTKQYSSSREETAEKLTVTTARLNNVFTEYFLFWEIQFRYTLGREYKYRTSSIEAAVGLLGNTEDEKIFKSLLQDLYKLSGNDEDRVNTDKCLTDREQLDKGNQNSNQQKVVGDYRYSSRLTIVYDNDLIRRYTETNSIDIDAANITVIPVNIRDLQFE